MRKLCNLWSKLDLLFRNENKIKTVLQRTFDRFKNKIKKIEEFSCYKNVWLPGNPLTSNLFRQTK
jgi:hypothetical protein